MTVFRHLARRTATLITGVAVLAAVAAAVCIAAGLRPQPVLTGSMEPHMPVGSLAVAQPVDAGKIAVGDVISFARPDDPSKTITHRVVAIRWSDGARRYTTKGDANATTDPWELRLPGQVGRRVAVVPKVGFVALYAARPVVRTAVIAVFALVLLLALLRRIWHDEDAAATPAPAGWRSGTPASGPALHAGWHAQS